MLSEGFNGLESKTCIHRNSANWTKLGVNRGSLLYMTCDCIYCIWHV